MPEPELARWASLVALTFVPWIELRGSIPLGLAWELNGWGVLAVTILANALIFLPTWIVLQLAYERWLRRTLVRGLVEGVRRRGQSLIVRYGTLGLALFVAVPLPGTGAYSGTVLAFLIGIPFGRAFAAVAAGVAVAGLVVMALSTGLLAGIRLL